MVLLGPLEVASSYTHSVDMIQCCFSYGFSVTVSVIVVDFSIFQFQLFFSATITVNLISVLFQLQFQLLTQQL
jgi:hypothetical protein